MVRLYAHRGAASELPENTLESFRRALEVGADALEMDVHMTADQQLVVAHDPTGARMCNVARAICATSYAQLSEWDAGWGFVRDDQRPYAERHMRIPRLADVLEEFPDTISNIDLKQQQPSIVGAFLSLMRRTGAADRVIAASFSARTMLALRAGGYHGMTALARPEVLALLALPGALFSRIPLLGAAAQVPVRAGRVRFDSPWFIRRCRAAGVRIDYWTINDPEHAVRLVRAGADGIMTDDPRAIAAALTEIA